MVLPETLPVRINIGAGRKRIDGYLNVDLDDSNADICADFKSIPLPDASVSEALGVHIFEHMYLWEVPDALAEWKRLLIPGGLLVLEMPDLIKCCQAILAGAVDRMGMWGVYGCPDYKNPLMTHHWGWTFQTIKPVLQEAGFVKIKERHAQFHKPVRDFRVEARKP